MIDGTTNGVLYGAIALALVLVFMTTRIINFAQGAMATMGAFIAYEAFTSWGFPAWAAILVAMAVSAVAGALLERALIRPFDPNNHLAIVIVTIGLYLGINALVGYIWGFDPRGFPDPFPNNVNDYVSIAGAPPLLRPHRHRRHGRLHRSRGQPAAVADEARARDAVGREQRRVAHGFSASTSEA